MKTSKAGAPAGIAVRGAGAIAILGAGAMGRAAVYDLCRGVGAAGSPRVLLLDSDRAAARRVARTYGNRSIRVAQADAGDAKSLARRLAGCAVVINCAPYTLNLTVMEAALAAGCHYLDLGGLFHTTRRQLPLDARFRRAGLAGVLGMGSAPGIVNVLAAAAVERMKSVKSVRIYNGGSDDTRYAGPLAFPFSPATVLDEFTRPAMVFAGGKFVAAPALTGAEDFDFEIGRQRVHYSLHSEVATIPLSFRDRGVRECFFKIAYDPAMIEKLKLLIDMGLTDAQPAVRGVSPREVLLACFRNLPPPPAEIDDRDSLAVVVAGRDERGALTVRYDLTARPLRKPALSAVACDTGFPPAIAARMILDGTITARGVLPPERCVPVKPFLAELARRGMRAGRRVRRG